MSISVSVLVSAKYTMKYQYRIVSAIYHIGGTLIFATNNDRSLFFNIKEKWCHTALLKTLKYQVLHLQCVSLNLEAKETILF